MLHRAGEIELSQEIAREAYLGKGQPGRWNDYRFFNTTVLVNGSLRITYDTHDRAWIDPDILSTSDLYFKRSYSRDNASEKVRPLGLNMQVNDAARDMFRVRRALLSSAKSWATGSSAVSRTMSIRENIFPRR